VKENQGTCALSGYLGFSRLKNLLSPSRLAKRALNAPFTSTKTRVSRARFLTDDENHETVTGDYASAAVSGAESVKPNSRVLRPRAEEENLDHRPEARLDRERPDDMYVLIVADCLSIPFNRILQSIAVYPPQGGTGAISISRGDRLRLDPGEFLNDTLIEFGLKCVVSKMLTIADLISYSHKRFSPSSAPRQ
jgi:hypothetical protein